MLMHTHIQHILCLDQLYYFILVNLVLAFVLLSNATDILHQWYHLALNSELKWVRQTGKQRGKHK